MSTSLSFFLISVIRISVMKNFKKSRLLLLKALRDLVSEDMENGSINPNFEQDVAEFFIEFTDKKRLRHLKMIRKEVDKWIEQMTSQEKMEEGERKFNEDNSKKASKSYLERINSP